MSQRRNKAATKPATSTSFSAAHSNLSSSSITTRPFSGSSATRKRTDDDAEITGFARTSATDTSLGHAHVKLIPATFGSLEEDGGIYDDVVEKVVDENSAKVKASEEEAMTDRKGWILLAVASGGCAAFNGVFAKLTTSEVTSGLATFISSLLHAPTSSPIFEAIVRAFFFALNLIFNGIMWTLFTKALARGTSTTQVSILNTSSNFMITALLGFIIFSESLPPLWWAGATLLVAGSVIIGAREEEEKKVIVEPEYKDGDALEMGESAEEEAKRLAILDSEDLLDFRE